MTDWLRSSLARVRRDGAACGGGILVDERHVLTCAHVVSAALNLKEEPRERPRGEIEIDFPETGQPPVKATVEEGGWFPIGKDGSWDIAVLRLEEDAPRECGRPPLLLSGNTQGHRYRTRGFPKGIEGLPTGAPAAGEILETAGPRAQWRLLSLERGPYMAQRGFSGCPVWDVEGEAVVGMYAITNYVTAEGERSSREAGYMITMETLVAAWPELERELGWRVRLDPQYERHWEPHSRGVRDSNQGGQLFTGRETALAQLRSWIEDGEEPAALVTARPGSGKSAVLAQIVTSEAPDTVTLALVADRETGSGEITERGMTVGGAAKAIANWTGVEAKGPRELVEKLRSRTLADDPAPLIVVDQLDEADDRFGLAQFLGRLAREGAARVLVGLRTDDWESGTSLTNAFGVAPLRIDLDTDFRDDRALLEYARKILRLTPDAGRDEDAVEDRAARIAERAGESFLRVQTMANLIVAQGTIEGPAEPEHSAGALDEIEEGLRAAAELEGGDREKVKQRLRHLFTPLAYAGPDGLPTEGRAWPAMASALSARSYTEEDVADLLDSPVAVLIQRGNTADGHPSARLHHPVLNEGLRHGRDAEADNGRIAAKLSELYSAGEPGPAEPYVALSLARHVAQATPQAWADLADRPHVLDRLDPVALGIAARPLLLQGAELPPRILGALDSQHLGASGELGNRPGLRQLGMARVCAKVSFGEDDAPRPISSWWLASAVLCQHTSHLALAAGSAVNGLATLVASDETPLLAAGCEDHAVRLWSAATGKPHGNPPDCERPVRAICACEVGSASWLVFGDESGLVTQWDPVSEDRSDFRADHGGQLRAISAFAAGKRLFVVTAGDDAEALVWHRGELFARLLTGAHTRALASRPVGEEIEIAAGNDDHHVLLWRLSAAVLAGAAEPPRLPPDETLSGASDWVRSVFLYGTGEAARVAAGGDDCKPLVWAPERPTPVMDPPSGHDGPILATVAYEGSPGAHRLATAGTDRAIRLWDPSAPDPEGLKLEGHDGSVRALATQRMDGAVSLVSGGADQTIRIWPLANAHSSSTSQGHLIVPPVTAVGQCEINGTLAAVTGYADGSARVWDPSTGEALTSRLPAHAGAVRAIAPVTVDDRPTFATGGDDGAVRFFDPLSGEQISPPLTRHEAPVRAIIPEISIAEETAIATGSEDGKVRFWSKGGAQMPIATWPQPGPVRDLAPLNGHPKGDGLAVSGYGRSIHLAMVDGAAERREEAYPAHIDWAMAVEVYTDGFGRPRVVTAGDDGAVVAFDPLANEPPERIGLHDGPVRALALIRRKDRLLVASGSDDGSIVLWNPDGSGPATRIELGLDVEALAAIDERLLVGTDEGHLVIEVEPG